MSPRERSFWRSASKDRSTAMDAIANRKKVEQLALTVSWATR